MFILSLVILLTLFILQVFFRPFLKKRIHWFVFAVPVIAFGVSVYYSVAQYLLWQSTEPSKYLLPPYTPVAYFLRYSLFHFFAPYIASLVLAGIFYFVAKLMNKKSGERFFEGEEIGLAAIVLFIAGFPGILFVFGFIIAAYLLIHLSNLVFKRKLEVIPVYYLWLPGGLFAIILTVIWLSRFNIWSALKIS